MRLAANGKNPAHLLQHWVPLCEGALDFSFLPFNPFEWLWREIGNGMATRSANSSAIRRSADILVGSPKRSTSCVLEHRHSCRLLPPCPYAPAPDMPTRMSALLTNVGAPSASSSLMSPHEQESPRIADIPVGSSNGQPRAYWSADKNVGAPVGAPGVRDTIARKRANEAPLEPAEADARGPHRLEGLVHPRLLPALRQARHAANGDVPAGGRHAGGPPARVGGAA